MICIRLLGFFFVVVVFFLAFTTVYMVLGQLELSTLSTSKTLLTKMSPIITAVCVV